MTDSRFIVFVNITEEIGERGNPKPQDLTVDKGSFTVYGDTHSEAVDDALAHLTQHSNRVAAKARVVESSPWDFTKKTRVREGLKYMGLATTLAMQLVDEFEAAVAEQKLELPVEKLIPMVWGWHMHAANERRKADEKVFLQQQADDDPTGALRAQDQAEIQEADELDGNPNAIKFGSLPLRAPRSKAEIPPSVTDQLIWDNPDKRGALSKADITQAIPVQPVTEQGPPDVTIDPTKGYFEPTGNWPTSPDDAPPAKDKSEEPRTGG